MAINFSKGCYGCLACKNSCPFGAIDTYIDEEGFIQLAKNNHCVGCGICDGVCPQNFDIKRNNIKKCFAYALDNNSNLLKSASGGFFYSLGLYVISQGGYVCGCVYDENLVPQHIVSDSIDDLKRMQGSKYVASDAGNTFLVIKKKLEEKKLVLFSGTPCQVHALSCFLKKEYDNLITVDLICHGTPSAGVYIKFLNYYRNNGAEILSINFRDKSVNGWNLLGSIKFKNGKKKIISPYNCAYYHYFDNGSIYRESCYDCKYAKSVDRVGDLTIGDFWGIEKSSRRFKKIQNGVSLVLVNTTKGEALFKRTTFYGHSTEKSLEFANRENCQLHSPVDISSRNAFLMKETMKLGYKFMDASFKKNGQNAFKHIRMVKIPACLKYSLKGIKKDD